IHRQSDRTDSGDDAKRSSSVHGIRLTSQEKNGKKTGPFRDSTDGRLRGITSVSTLTDRPAPRHMVARLPPHRYPSLFVHLPSSFMHLYPPALHLLFPSPSVGRAVSNRSL